MRVPNSSSLFLAALALSTASLGVVGAPPSGTVLFRDNAVLHRALEVAHEHDPRDGEGLLLTLGDVIEGLPVVGGILKPLLEALGLYEVPASAKNLASQRFQDAVAQLKNSLPANLTGAVGGTIGGAMNNLPIPLPLPVQGVVKGVTGALPLPLPGGALVDVVGSAPKSSSSSTWSSTSSLSSTTATSTLRAAEADRKASSSSSSTTSPSGISGSLLPLPMPSLPVSLPASRLGLPIPELPVRRAPPAPLAAPAAPAPPGGAPSPPVGAPAPPGGAPAPPGGAPSPPGGAPAPPALPPPTGILGTPAPPAGAPSSQAKTQKAKAADAPER